MEEGCLTYSEEKKILSSEIWRMSIMNWLTMDKVEEYLDKDNPLC